MKLLEKVCEDLGVEIGKEWTGSDGEIYQINGNGKVLKYNLYKFRLDSDLDGWERILTGELKPIWKPELGETYYIPDFHFAEYSRYDWYDWNESNFDNWCLQNKLICKTKEEAIDMTNKILKVLREDK